MTRDPFLFDKKETNWCYKCSTNKMNIYQMS